MYFIDRGAIRTVDENNRIVTLFGQKSTYGNNVNALNARFSSITRAYQRTNKKVIVADELGAYFKEFDISGNIFTIAGNGTYANINTAVSPTLGPLAHLNYWAINKSTGDIFVGGDTSHGGSVMRLIRTTSTWSRIMGGGTKDYWAAGTVYGSEIKGPNVIARGLVIGFDNNQLIMARMSTQNNLNLSQMIKMYNFTDSYRQSHVMGLISTEQENQDTVCDETFPSQASTCKSAYWDRYGNWNWNATNNRWIFYQRHAATHPQQRRIFSLNSSGVIDVIGTTSSNIDDSGLYIERSGVEYFYYCNSGRLRRYNITTNGPDDLLEWTTPNLRCTGQSLDYDSDTNTLIFPFTQNGAFGVARYFLD